MPHSDEKVPYRTIEHPTAVLPSAIDLSGVLRAFRRRWHLIIFIGVIGAIGGLLQFKSMPPSYTAEARLMIDSRTLRTLHDAYVFSSGNTATLDMSSQIEVLRSDTIASRVADKLDLVNKNLIRADITFQSWQSHLKDYLNKIAIFQGIFSPKNPEMHEALARRQAIDELHEKLNVSLVEDTAVIKISFSSSDPQFAADAANAFAEAYIEDQQTVRRDAARNATEWLNEQLDQLKMLVEKSNNAIQDYKTNKNIIATEGQLIDDQRLSDGNRQLLLARAQFDALRARYQQMQSAVNASSEEIFTADIISDPLASQLRVQYVNLLSEEARLTDKLGENHQAVQRIREQINRAKTSLQREYQRIAKTLGSELDRAKAEVKELETKFNELAKSSTQTNIEQIELRELQRRNDAYEKMYTNLLERHQAAIQQQSFEDRNARIISPAVYPGYRDGPSAFRVLIFGLVLGLTAGSGVAYLPELWDRSFRTRKAVRDKLNINAVWFIPVTSQYGFLRRCLHRLPGIFRHRSCGGKGKLNPDLFYGFDDARSPFSETLEAIKLVISRQMDQKKSKVIGVVSTFENERKELIAANLAYVASKTGAKTLLIDGNLRSDGLTALANAQDLPGLTEIATKSSSLESAIVNDQFSGFAFLPSGRKESIAFSGDLLASSSLKDFLTDTKNAYDFILLDLPPMGLYFDSEAIAPTLDAIILVVEWGKTAQNDVYDAFYEMPSVREKCIGAVLGVKNLGELRYYETIYSLRTRPKSRTKDKNLDRRSQVVSDNADIEMVKFDYRAA